MQVNLGQISRVSRDPNPPNTQPETRDWRTGEVWNIIEKLLIHNNDVSFHATKYLAKSTYLHTETLTAKQTDRL
jgi:hypothetical protein